MPSFKKQLKTTVYGTQTEFHQNQVSYKFIKIKTLSLIYFF